MNSVGRGQTQRGFASVGRIAAILLVLAAAPAGAQIPAGGQLAILFGGDGFGGRAVADVMYHAARDRSPSEVIAGIEGRWLLRDPNGAMPSAVLELVENPFGACTLLDNDSTLRLAIRNGATPLESRILCRVRYGGPWPESGFGIRLIAQTPFAITNPLGQPANRPPLMVLNGNRTDAFVPAGSVSPVIEFTVPPDGDQRIDAVPEIVFRSPPAEGEFSTYRFQIVQRTSGNGSFGVTTFASCWLDAEVGTGGTIQLTSFGFHQFSSGTASEPPRTMELRCLGTPFETRATLICAESRLIQGRTHWWDIRCPSAGSGEAGNQPDEPPLFRDGFEAMP